MNNLNNLFLDYCKTESFEVNQAQLEIIDQLSQFKNNYINTSFFKFFSKQKEKKLGIYLHGDVGVGKTMLLNFFFDNLDEKKTKTTF